ncbi:type II toxin-antitoxin system HipA family toxin [Cryobacterium luteum]|uniref:Type II toxin-antitoxin system HipA family toxin n=1 Tax=Cryobacterium luteum TaxID=1424661 RepID=A0A1H8L1J6_9MICO|nr:type II toxin-antitoxin system HipA family toxin [Cryobacterium luteum]TFB82350.1 type II toxin-antitoxin system HipA family toxin [Cryobacterium luteum]SEN98959.1 serine/threonine-protein kinase HipA [Cryobacterium luteum]
MTLYDALEVHVEIAGETVLAGRAQFHRNRGNLTSTTFQYDQGYLAHTSAYSLDPALQLVSGTQQTQGLPGAFSDSAPDRWGRNLIKKRERLLARAESRRPRDFDDADFLAGVSDVTRQGALRYRTKPGSAFLDPEHTVPRLLRLPELLHAADTASRDTSDDGYEALKLLLAAGTGSLGGARPKAAVLDTDGRQLIAKFPHPEDEWDVMAWEATALNLAAAAGVTVPRRQLVRVDGRHVLLLNRFERAENGNRIGYTSVMTMLGHRDGESADYVDIAEILSEVSSQATEDSSQLFRRVAVSVGLNNTDDHLRNHGFLRVRGGWTLSPAFDVNPNPDPELRQTTIAGADSPAEEAAGLMELARSCRLSAVDARGVLAGIADEIGRWQEVAMSNGVPQSQLARFEASFATGLKTLRAA